LPNYYYESMKETWFFYLTEFYVICDSTNEKEKTISAISKLKNNNNNYNNNNNNKNKNNTDFQKNLIVQIFKKLSPTLKINIEAIFLSKIMYENYNQMNELVIIMHKNWEIKNLEISNEEISGRNSLNTSSETISNSIIVENEIEKKEKNLEYYFAFFEIIFNNKGENNGFIREKIEFENNNKNKSDKSKELILKIFENIIKVFAKNKEMRNIVIKIILENPKLIPNSYNFFSIFLNSLITNQVDSIINNITKLKSNDNLYLINKSNNNALNELIISIFEKHFNSYFNSIFHI